MRLALNLHRQYPARLRLLGTLAIHMFQVKGETLYYGISLVSVTVSVTMPMPISPYSEVPARRPIPSAKSAVASIFSDTPS